MPSYRVFNLISAGFPKTVMVVADSPETGVYVIAHGKLADRIENLLHRSRKNGGLDDGYF
jgi:hypothetical protein